MTLELTGNEPKIEAFLETLQPFGIQEIARTGSIAMVRDSNGKM
jgi:acetolactate synthase-1/3 small subunit